MSQANLDLAVFDEIGDFYVLELEDITNAVSFLSYQEIVTNQAADRTFLRHFKYSTNHNTPSGWIVLNNTNLLAIPVNQPSDTFKIWIRYIRTGANSTGSLIWNEFQLNVTQAQSCVMLRVNRPNWLQLYNGPEKFIRFSEKIQLFNSKCSIPKFNTVVYIVNDVSVPSGHIYATRSNNTNCLAIDINMLMKELWGNYLVDLHFKQGIDTFDGLPDIF